MRIAALVLFASSVALTVACGGSAKTPPAAPTSTPSPSEAIPGATSEPEAKAPSEAAPTSSPTSTPTPADPVAEKCEGGWTCVKVSFDTKKVEPRETKLLGDPKIEETWSKTSDGRTVTLDAFSKGAVDLALKRKANNKNEVVAKLGPKGTEIVIDRKDGTPDDFAYVGLIATEQNSDLLVDIRYMK